MAQEADAENQAVVDEAPALAENITEHLQAALSSVTETLGIGMQQWSAGDDEVILGVLTRYTEFVAHSKGFRPGGNFHAGLLYHTFERAFYDDGTLIQQVEDYMNREERPEHFEKGLNLGEATVRTILRNKEESVEAPVRSAFTSNMTEYFQARA
ncbi:hypothetical protein [Thiohalorhabdus methylotrophus]|uniref:Uncharacterized protein n=1 Tax=Thiohalorhabdus methylotrophus TaxID=3242694 RepID=A0ABV4U1R2_9GAMM